MNDHPPAEVIDAAYLAHQHEFSLATFGPGSRTAGVLDHIEKELIEIRDAPHDIAEWADLLILAFDGAMRNGHSPQDIIDAIKAKQKVNEGRTWPDWRTQDPDKAITHVRPDDESVAVIGDHPHTDPGDGRVECYTCGKFVYPVTHSCKGVPVTPAAVQRGRNQFRSNGSNEG